MINVNLNVFRFMRAKSENTIRFTCVIPFGVPSKLRENLLLFPNSEFSGSWHFCRINKICFFEPWQKKLWHSIWFNSNNVFISLAIECRWHLYQFSSPWKQEHSHLVFRSSIELVWMCNEQMKYVLCGVYAGCWIIGRYIFDMDR